jgi:O-antigen biosynthesis alpha-1,3-rhamnosyltransferase
MLAISIIIPTYNASRYLDAQLKALLSQSIKDSEIIIVDSSSSDNTLEIAKSYGVHAFVIPKKEFDHGGTRTLAGKKAKGEFLIYLTQDALPCDAFAIANLLQPLLNEKTIGAVFGRQVPYPDATPFAKHLRYFNYPEKSYIRSANDRRTNGVRTVFCSNSFAAYRRSALEDVGWFKQKLTLGEDMLACAIMLLKGYKLGYVSEATVYHSHNYSLVDEFKRYFDTGVFHKMENWILEEFGRPEGEGLRYIKSEISFLIADGHIYLLPLAIIRNSLKFVGYKLGYHYNRLPGILVKQLSMRSSQ